MSDVLGFVDARTAARDWIAATITKHLHPDVAEPERIQHVATEIERTAFERNMPVEIAVSLAAGWCDQQNEEGLSHASETQ